MAQSERAKDIFWEAVELPPEQRAEFLGARCAGDAALRAEVESLLRAHQQADKFLAAPTVAATATDPSAADLPGKHIGPYKLLQVIGEGGFGTVYMAEQEHPVRRRVALKVIKLGMDTRQVIARFEAERQALAIMDHPNIARVFDAGATETGRPFFVMELVKGDPITRYCDSNRLTPRQRLELFVPVCQAVQHAHQKGIIHRDIKPSNVLVTLHDGKPVPKVIDFGIAKATQARLTEKTLFTEFRQMIGTPEYMSPEQAEMSGLDIDTRSDIYSLGVLLYELLTGTTPFDARELRSKAFAEIQRVIREEDPPRMSTRISTLKDSLASIAAQRNTEPKKLGTIVRGELDWIVMKCMEKDRTRRYDSASSLAADVTNYLQDAPVSAASPTAMYRMGKFVRRHKMGFGVAASIFLALLIGLILALYGLGRATRAERLAQQRLEDVSREAAKSRAVNEFLTSMLRSADPYRVERADLTVREAMENAIQEIDAGTLAHQSEIEAAVRATIGGVLQSLGRVDASIEQLRRALEAGRRRTGAADDPEVARTLNLLGMALAERGELEEAERVTREAIDMRTRLLGENSLEVAESLGNLASIRADKGDHAEAEKLYRRALDVQQKLPWSEFGTEPKSAAMTRGQNIATTLNNLARTLRILDRIDEAERLYRDAIDQQRAALGPRNPLRVLLMNNLAILLLQQQRYPEAEQIEREALGVARAALPPAHQDTLLAMYGLATALLSQMKYDQADPLYRELIEGMRRDKVMSRALLGDVLFSYWTIAADRGRLDEAEALARELLKLRIEQTGLDSRETALAQTRLAYVFAKRSQNLEEAEAMIRAALTPPEKLGLPETHWVLHNQRGLLGDVLLQRGRVEEAEPLIVKAYQIISTDPIALPRAKRDARDRLIRLYEKLGKTEEAAKLRAATPASAPARR